MAHYRGFVLDPGYRIREGVPVVQLFGRLDDGMAFLVEEDRFRPYFFVLSADRNARRLLDEHATAQVSETNLRDFRGEPVLRVQMPLPSAVPPLRDALLQAGSRSFEADVRFPYRFLIDHGLRACVEIEGDAEPVNERLVRFRRPSLRPGHALPELQTLSLDLETSPDASEILSIALVGCGIQEVHLRADQPVAGAHNHSTESELLTAAIRRVQELDPDILTGWNVVDFDLRTWHTRARALNVPFHMGRTRGEIRFEQDAGFTRQSRARVPGRMVLDAIPLVRDAVRLDDYRLETAARHILGRGKLIDQHAPDSAEEISRLAREDPEALVAYNREDAQLVLDILEHEGLLALTVERSLLSGMQLDRVGASIASFDLVYLPELRKQNHVAPNVDRARNNTRVRGGTLLEPSPGIFENIAVFDFKSLYPSLMRTFQLDPLAHAAADSAFDAAIEAPNGAHFARQSAILPEIIERFMDRREQAKERGDRHANQALKIMMNAMFGVLGSPSCRFFDPAIANAITSFGQQTLHWTREAFEDQSVRVLYGDTDSVFVQLDHGSDTEATHAWAETLRQRAEEQITERIQEQYHVTSVLELELEKIFERFFLPRVRGGSSGSKKRYAGWRNGALEMVGLESVRRDWPSITERLQRGLLERVFTESEVLPFVAELVGDLRAGNLDDELVYIKRIRKGSLERYTASSPPHVKAARKLDGPVGPVIRYVITSSGPEPVVPGAPLPSGIDYPHYIERVLRPVADAILPHLDLEFAQAMGEPRQMSLL
ncbi:DNA polymerase II [Myxococcota bacterium]|nr:DNA polymerase II [Myxococcota bacterium]